MNFTEKKMTDILIDLKENHYVKGVKTEFETEGTSLQEALKLKEITAEAGVDLVIKIGGCGAVKDLIEVRKINPSGIIAPMIESAYAMEKFIKSVDMVFGKSQNFLGQIFINIETITGFRNLEDIFRNEKFRFIDGIVFGRSDMAESMEYDKNYVNSDEIFKMANKLSKELKLLDKEMIVGGNVSCESLVFFKKLHYFSKFETRKIIFDASAINSDENAKRGILKALEFELLWLKNRQECEGFIIEDDKQRIQKITHYLNGKKIFTNVK